MEPRVLFVSNGHGEDTIGARIARLFMDRSPAARTLAVPIVGLGEPYQALGVPIEGPTKTMPSGGFIWRRPRALVQDVRFGLLGHVREKLAALKRLAAETDLLVGVGDKVILYVNHWFMKLPMVFVGAADSAHYVQGRTVFTEGERRIMRRYAKAVYARDALSARLLSEKLGVPMAQFVGNPMMDCFDVTGLDFGFDRDVDVVGVLPGSRQEAYANLALILAGIQEATSRSQRPIGFVAAIADSLQLDAIERSARGQGWEVVRRGESEDKGVVAELRGHHGARLLLTRGLFGDVIHRATVVIGLAGTANEQAAGLGKPVITFPGSGAQITPRFVEAQARLLGGAVTVTRPEPAAIAAELLDLLSDEHRRQRMGKAGRERMGEPGAAEKIVQGIEAALSEL